MPEILRDILGSNFEILVVFPLIVLIATVFSGSIVASFLDTLGWWLYIGCLFAGIGFLFKGYYLGGSALILATLGFSVAKHYRDKREAEKLQKKYGV